MKKFAVISINLIFLSAANLHAQIKTFNAAEVAEYIQKTQRCSPLWALEVLQGKDWIEAELKKVPTPIGNTSEEKAAAVILFSTDRQNLQEKVFKEVNRCLIQLGALEAFLPEMIRANRATEAIAYYSTKLLGLKTELSKRKTSRKTVGQLLALFEKLEREFAILPDLFAVQSFYYSKRNSTDLEKEIFQNSSVKNWIQYRSEIEKFQNEIEEELSINASYERKRYETFHWIVLGYDSYDTIQWQLRLNHWTHALEAFSKTEAPFKSIYDVTVQAHSLYQIQLQTEITMLHNIYVLRPFFYTEKKLSQGYIEFYLEDFERMLTTTIHPDSSLIGIGEFSDNWDQKIKDWILRLQNCFTVKDRTCSNFTDPIINGTLIYNYLVNEGRAWEAFEQKAQELKKMTIDELIREEQSTSWNDFMALLRSQ